MVVTILELGAGDVFSFPTIAGLDKQEEYPTDSSQIVTYTGEQPLSVYTDLLISFSYVNTMDEPEPGRRNVSVRVYSPGEDGSPLGSNLATVTIDIVPVNDNSPVFNQTSYTGSVPENAPAGSSVGVTILASDSDVHSGTSITYQISGGSNDFVIDMQHGSITTLRPLDADSENRVYNLTIVASDNDSPPRTSVVIVTIEVLDENDNAPVFTQALYNTSLLEDTVIGASVIQVFAEDQDITPEHSEFFFRIETLEQLVSSGSGLTPSEDTVLPFEIDPQSGVISLIDFLDFEDTREYAFTAIVEDTGLVQTPLETAQVLVFIFDANDNSPEFVDAPYSASIREDAKLSTSVLQVFATDRDSSTNALIEYSLEGTSSFAINPVSGEVVLAQSLDYEVSTLHEFTVVAHDMGTDARSTTAEVSVEVLNVNDEPPFFNPATYNFNVSENSGAFEDQVFAFDRDGFDLSYQPLSGFGDDFELNQTTGLLSSSPGFSFDYERQTQYNLVVRVTDGNFSDDAPVTINVLDENDLPPQFDQDSYSSALSENASVGTVVLQVAASDGDTGSNAESEFSITAGNVDGAFTIDPITGDIVVASTIDFDTEPSLYTLMVVVRNIEPPFFSDSVTVVINVTDVNDIQPMLSLAPLSITFNESSDPVAVAASISVTDPDSNAHPLTQCTATLYRGQCGLAPDELSMSCGSSLCIERCAESIWVDELVAESFGLSVINHDASNSQTLSVVGHGSETAYQQVLRTLTYYNSAREPVPGARNISIQCQDSLLVSDTLQISVIVELLDEFCPEIDVLVDIFEYVEGSDVLNIGQQAGFAVTDRDREPHDVLNRLEINLIDPLDYSHESISVNVHESFGLTLMVTNTGEEDPLMLASGMSDGLAIRISGVANVSVYEQVLSTLTYTNTRSEPTLGTRHVEITQFSDVPECSAIELEINVMLVNDNPPELILNETDTLFYVEESGDLHFAIEAGLEVVDLDHNSLFRMESATVTLVGASDLGMEHLGFDSDQLPANVSVTASTGGEHT